MNCNDYKKVVHCMFHFGDKVMLSKILKKCYHQGFYSDPGGKVEKNESIKDAVIREVLEETEFQLYEPEIVDCFVYPKRELKTFVFKIHLPIEEFKWIGNPEPKKQSNWELFTIKEALKLKLLMPSVQFYLESLNKKNKYCKRCNGKVGDCFCGVI